MNSRFAPNKRSYPKQLIEAFVDEWEKAPSGTDSFKDVCSRYPAEFGEVWEKILGEPFPERVNSWGVFKERMVQELHINRTKLGRALR